MPDAAQLSFEPSQVIFREGEIANELYILEEGQIEVSRDGKKLEVLSERGTFLGEMSFLMVKPRTTTFRALSPVVVKQVIRGADFEQAFLDHPRVFFKLLRLMATRLDVLAQDNQNITPYRKFRQRVYEKAIAENSEKLQRRYAQIDYEVNRQQQSSASHLIQEAIDPDFLFEPLMQAVEQTIPIYYRGEFKTSEIKEFRPLRQDFDLCCTIKYSGEKHGCLGLAVSKAFILRVMEGFIGERSEEDSMLTSTLMELCNQVLGLTLQNLQLHNTDIALPEIQKNRDDFNAEFYDASGCIRYESDDGDVLVVKSIV